MSRDSFRVMPARAIMVLAYAISFPVDCPAEVTASQNSPVLLQMIRDASVHENLGLSAAQTAKVFAAIREVDGPWFRSRNLAVGPRGIEIGKLTDQLDGKLQAILDEPQQRRLRQLQYQALGARMLLRDDVATALSLTKEQRDALLGVFQSTDQATAQLQQQGRQKDADLSTEINLLKQQELKRVTEHLTDDQEQRWGALSGTPFNFSSVRRTYPLAPELSLEGGRWIQGGPIELGDLKGKVVAIHFYAFQCINCQRNLPHYSAWLQAYADRDLVVIGIQTPETSAERQPDQVASAARQESIKYPILHDLKSTNWKNWSNTMWPTVYLIDKKGFLRRWWQGELNWEGSNGEQQMRQTIEQLLAEQD
jgi:peroxiredoxin|tara:strand:- start:28 stop:1125 length:1098 start_codon:yes stop_codon:yes gene_type:complete